MPSIDVIPSGPCRTYSDVLERLHALDARLAATDGLRWFGRLYADMTAAVAAHAAAGGFRAPVFMEALDCIFADLYFSALRNFLSGAGNTPGAWRPLFELRADARLTPLQFAIAGVNAHINRDLPLALVATFERFGLTPARDQDACADYVAINPILATVHEAVKSLLITGALAGVDAALGPIDDALELWSLERARDAAWVAAEVRWQLRASRFLLDQQLYALDGLVNLASRAILRPGIAHIS
jgi:Family of unknown function (DUF5995)